MNARELKMTPEQLERERQRQVAARSERRERTRPKRRVSKEAKEARATERRIRLKVAAETVHARAQGACEVCKRTDLRLEIDHLVSGGLRRHRESAETLLAVCPDCHRAKHRNDRATLRAYLETTIRLGMREGKIAIERRLDKMEAPCPW